MLLKYIDLYILLIIKNLFDTFFFPLVLKISVEELRTIFIFLLLSSRTRDNNLNPTIRNSAINFIYSFYGSCFS